MGLTQEAAPVAERAAATEPQVAVVTGSGRGVGRACVERFCSEGWTVAGFEIAPSGPLADPDARFDELGIDITDEEAVAAAMQEVVERLGRPSVCVNAAGIYPTSTLLSMDTAQYRRVFDLNVLGSLLVAQAFVRQSDESRPRSIINIASLDAYDSPANLILYSASKAAVVTMTIGMAHELGQSGIRAIAISPTWIDTATLRAGLPDLPKEDCLTPAEVAGTVFTLATSPDLLPLAGQAVRTNTPGL